MAELSTSTCAVAECGRPRKPNGRGQFSRYCSSHRSRKTRHGDLQVDVPIRPLGDWHHDRPSYETAHKRVAARRGPAATHTCPCGQQAAEWSYQGSSAAELTEERVIFGERVVTARYSSDPADYQPLCLSCHRRADHRKAS